MSSDTKTPEQKVRRYLERMRELRPSATDEQSFYDALGGLLSAVGGELNPKVTVVQEPANLGFGQPDFGLCASEKTKRERKNSVAPVRKKPDRGVVEAKGLNADLDVLARSEQVGKYLRGYGIVLATNYREFALVERDSRGKPVIRERREIADSEETFWAVADTPQKTARERGIVLCQFLRRALKRAAPITKAEEVADLLASYACESAEILEQGDALALTPLRESLESSLGIKFEGDDGDHLFRSTLVQTVFYGLFSAWMESNGGKFDWKSAAFAVKTPVIRTLFSEIVNPVRIGDLGIRPLLDSAAAALNRVESKDGLFRGKGAFHAIQHFYEPFLAAFDPGLRKDLGVWYTPPEIVRYMVRRVDHVLRTELKVADGLASDNVRVLDPCGGTGAYLAETLSVVRETLEKRGDGPTMAARGMKRAAQSRIFGFEILPASFVIAHWQIGALLAEAQAPLKNGERAAVYLTNALTGWEENPQMDIPFRELAEERAAAGKVKREEPILVVIGNPPYNAFAGKSPAEEGGLIAPYLKGLHKKWGISRHSLNDLYVRFFRIAERRIVKSGRGIVCYISNHSYVRKPSFVVMRQNLLREFNRVWIDNLNGSAYAGGKTPDGRPDPSVFSTTMNKGGIQVGTAVGLFARKGGERAAAATLYRDLWGEGKRAALEASLRARNFDTQYERAAPAESNRFFFRPIRNGGEYLQWPSLADFADEINGKKRVYNGPIERRGMSLIRFPGDVRPMLDALSAYLDSSKSDAEVREMEPRFMRSSGEYKAPRDRAKVLRRFPRGKAEVDEENLAAYPFKPFDLRVAYLDANVAPLFSRPSPELLSQRDGGNWFLISRDYCDKADEGAPMLASRLACDYSALANARHFPVWFSWRENGGMKCAANLSKPARAYLGRLGFNGADGAAAELLWLHALAVGYSPEYRSENADDLQDDWPRVPLPKKRAALEKSAKFGREIMRLLESDIPAAGVDSGKIPARFRVLAQLKSSDQTPDLTVRGGERKAESRPWTAKESAALTARQRELLGDPTDVYLNGSEGDGTFWSGVPAAAWEFRIGNHQVAKKWLSYRKESTLGRPLRDEEVLHFTAMIRRLSALVLMTDELDANYRASRDDAAKWGK